MPSERSKPAPPPPLHRAGQFANRPGSPNRGFASSDPERQRESAESSGLPAAAPTPEPAEPGRQRAPRKGGGADKARQDERR